MEKEAREQRLRRDYKVQIGFCADCTAPAVPGRTRCPSHLKKHNAMMMQWREKAKKVRGWKLVRMLL